MTKITKGSYDRNFGSSYSRALIDLLVLQLLRNDPNDRPTMRHVVAHPILIKPILSVMTSVGSIAACVKYGIVCVLK